MGYTSLLFTYFTVHYDYAYGRCVTAECCVDCPCTPSQLTQGLRLGAVHWCCDCLAQQAHNRHSVSAVGIICTEERCLHWQGTFLFSVMYTWDCCNCAFEGGRFSVAVISCTEDCCNVCQFRFRDVILAFSTSTLLVECQEGYLACKTHRCSSHRTFLHIGLLGTWSNLW